jgi:hypothetical protein
MNGHTDADAAFFDLVHSIVESDPAVEEQERREHERLDYKCVQLVAPFDGVNLPTQADFLQVHCHDLSERGVAFTTTRHPKHGWYVVALGAIPFTFVKAKVCTAVPIDKNGVTEYRVGCEFTSKF